MSPWLMRIGIWLLFAALVGRRVTDVSRTRGNKRTQEDTTSWAIEYTRILEEL